MSQHENPSAPQPQSPGYQPTPAPTGYQPAGASTGYAPPQQQFANGGLEPNPPKRRNVVGLIALIVAIVGFIFACIPGALIVGWVLLPIAFILAIVSFFQRGKGKGLGTAALIVSVVGTIVGVIVFLAVVATSFNDAFNEASTATAPSAAAPADEDAEEAAPAADGDAAEGTRENPLPIGSTISSDEWSVTVDAYNADGNAVVASSEYNEAAPAGSHYEIVTYTVTYTGDESSMAAMVGVDLVTSSGNVINSYESPVLLEDGIGIDELFNGASTSGSAAFTVPDGETVLIRVRPGMLADEMFIQP